MATPDELERKFWKALDADRTVMLGLAGVAESHTRPMTAQIEGERGPLWFFTTRDTALVANLGSASRAVCTFASKDHELFASVHGSLRVATDRATVERLWNPFIAAWYEGKDDPKLVLLRLDPDRGEVWLNESSMLAGIKMLLGSDPKKDYRDKAAKVNLA
jgi:general stress protein 26